jgi:hypothetical protein
LNLVFSVLVTAVDPHLALGPLFLNSQVSPRSFQKPFSLARVYVVACQDKSNINDNA